MRRIAHLLTSARTFWIPLVAGLLLSGVAFALGSGAGSQTAPGVGLPDTAESARVAVLQQQLPGADTTAALLVYTAPTPVGSPQPI